jgi:DNA-binding response OmpR family regulator
MTAAATPADSTTKKRTIQVVDDELDIISSLKLGLEDNGFRVDAFTDPIATLSNFKAGIYDLVILDIKMPYEWFRIEQRNEKK